MDVELVLVAVSVVDVVSVVADVSVAVVAEVSVVVVVDVSVVVVVGGGSKLIFAPFAGVTVSSVYSHFSPAFVATA